MEAKHTPGPWHVYKGRGLYVDSSTAGLVCKVAENRSAEKEANALLIAAAPELLEALREVVLLFDDAREGCLLLARADHKPMTNRDQEVIDKAFIVAEAAIRKAKGL